MHGLSRQPRACSNFTIRRFDLIFVAPFCSTYLFQFFCLFFYFFYFFNFFYVTLEYTMNGLKASLLSENPIILSSLFSSQEPNPALSHTPPPSPYISPPLTHPPPPLISCPPLLSLLIRSLYFTVLYRTVLYFTML